MKDKPVMVAEQRIFPHKSRPAGPIFVNGIWKSGNHLVYSALNTMGVAGPFNGIAAHLTRGSHPIIKRLVRGRWPGQSGIDVGLETKTSIRPSYIRQTLRRLEGRIVGGHAAYSPELFALLQAENARMIAIRRDPRDILISFADWIGTRQDFFLHPYFEPLDRDARIRLLLRGNADYKINPFPRVISLAEGWLNAPGVMQVRFEDLIGEQGGGLRDKQTRVVADLHTHVGAATPLNEIDIDKIYGHSLTFNKGRTSRWRAIEDNALRDEIADKLGPHLSTWGYSP